MRIFVTGATGFIGSAIVAEIVKAGHVVTGLSRSQEKTEALERAGAMTHQGHLEDLDSLRSGAAASDGVIHTGFVHDFARFKEVCEIDRRAIGALGSALVCSDRPLVITSGTTLIEPGKVVAETDAPVADSTTVPRLASEEAAAAVTAQGVRVAVIRPSTSVHGDSDHGFVPALIALAREKNASAYVGDGANRWPAVHRLDAASVFRLAVEQATAGTNYHAVADEGVAFRDIAEVIGRRLQLPVVGKSPEEAEDHFGWLSAFVGLDVPASSRETQRLLGWKPKQTGLIADLEGSSRYFAA